MIRKRGPRALAVLTVGLLAAGCANAGATEATSDGSQVLALSLEGLTAGNYTFTRTHGETVQGVVHLPGSSLISQPPGPSVLRAGTALYLRYRIHGEQHDRYRELYAEEAARERKALRILAVLDGEKWVRADEKRLVAAAAAEDRSGLEYLPPTPTDAQADVTGATALIGAASAVRRSGSTLTGTIDATLIDPELRLFVNDPYYFYGPRARTMPFRATLDDQGRLTEITVAEPGQLQAAASQDPAGFPADAPTEAPGPPLKITISRYGVTTAPVVPAGVTELDPHAYEMLTDDID